VAEGFGTHFKRFFLRGLAAVLPTVVTIFLIVWVFSAIHKYCGQYINKGGAELTTRLVIWESGAEDPDTISRIRSRAYTRWEKYYFWVGFVLAIFGIYFIGRFLASFFGRFLWRMLEKTFIQLPLIKQIYPSVKQVTDFLLAERKMEFSKVVAVEYPRKGIWSLGLVTNNAMRTLDESLEGRYVTVFIPSSPTPFTGYTITIRRTEVIDLPMSIDEALRFTISGGVIQPPGELTGEQPVEDSVIQPVLPERNE
jgi:uncharacterized membrane protein